MTRSALPAGVFASLLLMNAVMSAPGAEIPLVTVGETTLTWAGEAQSGYRPRLLLSGTVLAEASAAAGVQIVGADGAVGQLSVNYQTVDRSSKGVIARAHFISQSGTELEVEDEWSADTEGFLLVREIRCARKGTETAYASSLEMAVSHPKELSSVDVFIPGLWYANASHTPKSGLITDHGQQHFILREDRMPLPLVSVRDKSSGRTFTLAHVDPDGATILADDDLARVVDDRLRFGSLGIRRDSDGLRVAFVFPGTEGEQTGIFGYKPDLRTVERFHPIKVGAVQHYQLKITSTRTKDFREQLRAAWRDAWGVAGPGAVMLDAGATYAASVGVLYHYWYEQGEVAGFPFGVSLPDGKVKDPSLQMGFVGQQLPCASYLIDDGLRSNRPEMVARGEKVVDFWVKNSFNENGVPRTWFDLTPTPHWRNYNTFLRVVTDGTSGALRAWQIERAAGRDKPQWLAFSRRVGDWLLEIQNPDGSFYREWKFDGRPASQSKTSTLHPVRLLVDLSCATGEMKYRVAALHAAGFALKENASGAHYVGGTPDNPDVIDKEAGWIAMESYLALHDVTADRKWLDAAIDAAAFTETWIYAWNIPLPIDNDAVGVPRVKTFAGTNLIATGHSGADNFLAFASFSFTRLWIYTGGDHWLDVAKLLQHNAAQFVDVDGSLGYAVPGLQVEAFSLAVNRGHSVRVWLPWLTSATLEPMLRMREAFGVIDVDSVASLAPDQRLELNRRFARGRGYPSPAKP